MLAADLSRVAAMAGMAAAAFTGALAVIVYVLAGFMAVASKTFRPAQAALLPLLAESPEELTAANATSTAIESVGTFLGPALGGLLLAATSVGWVFVADALTLVWSAIFVVQLHSRPADAPTARPERRNTFREAVAGFSTLWARARRARHRLPLLLPDDRRRRAARAARRHGARPARHRQLGPRLPQCGDGRRRHHRRRRRVRLDRRRKRLATDFGLGLILIGAGLGLIGVWPTVIGAILLIGVFGIGNTLVDVSGVTLLQRAVPDEVLGRVFGALQSILVLGLAVGALIVPFLLDVISIRAALIVVGALLPVLAVILWRQLSAIDERAHVPVERIELLRANPIFAPLPPATIENLAMKLIPVSVAAGEIVFRQGDHGDLFYIVEDGRCEISIDGEKVADAWPGEAFGEIALLRDIPRTGTAKAVDDTKLLALERDEFIAAVTGHAPSREAADALVGARLPAPMGIGSA